MKILNIDAFVKPKRSITLGGQDHVVKELDVDAFIENVAAAEAVEANKDAKVGDHINLALASLAKSLPTVDAAVLRKLPMEAIGAMLQFVRGELDDQASEATPASEGASAKKPD
jgi:hypothetical protein